MWVDKNKNDAMIRIANGPKRYFFYTWTAGNSKIPDLICVELDIYVLMCVIHP